MILSNNLEFDPIRYRPIAERISGVEHNQKLLDGVWRIHPDPPENAVGSALNGRGWGKIRVPGQWLQQGYEVAEDQPVAMATQFTIPKEWAGQRIFIRFDSIHAGTHYYLNGAELGYSELLFVPVEWEITKLARPGRTNRLDLRMTVKTFSESLAVSNWYAHHNLGGIDRSVRIYALPMVHVRDLHLETDLDSQHRDANLRLDLTLDNALEETTCEGLSLRITLKDPKGKAAEHSVKRVDVGTLEPGTKAVTVTTHVPAPLKWTDEHPHLYSLALELTQGARILERIQRNVGFRKLEIRGSQFYVNGTRVKLAGICRHEFHPITGRADTMQYAESDVRMLKEANLNYIRTSHYPPTRELLDAADRIGVYVEVEAPMCWVRSADPKDQELHAQLIKLLPACSALVDASNEEHVRALLNPVSAMVDYFHAHPSAIIWSLANESVFSKAYVIANELCKTLDPTRLTTFNFAMQDTDNLAFQNTPSGRVCDLGNLHYPDMLYDEKARKDPRPTVLGEYFFALSHEQDDIRIDPGLRELWGHGHSDPDSDWGKECAASFDMPFLKPGAKPGAWSHIYYSDRLIGAAIWAAVDEVFAYAHGRRHPSEMNWGLLDTWRRLKPEWWIAKCIYSPIWFLARKVTFTPGQTVVRVPVENRYAFTDFKDLVFRWEIRGRKGRIKTALAPASRGKIEIPVSRGTKEGEEILLSVHDRSGALIVSAGILLGQHKTLALPEPEAGAPSVRKDGKVSIITGNGFSLAFSHSTSDFAPTHPKHRAAITNFPKLHLTQYDFGDLAAYAGHTVPPRAEFPDAKTRVVDSVVIEERPNGVEIAVHDHYDGFSGSVRWLIDAKGMGQVSYDYAYSGPQMNTREIGLRFLLESKCDEVQWRRWSEWGDVFPEDQMSRTEGVAKAHRDKSWGKESWDKRPEWPWSLDETELGTVDFRAMKFHIYEASLLDKSGKGVRAHANADVHFRPALSPDGVQMHLISKCRLGQIVLKPGEKLQGCYTLEILNRRK